MIIHYFKKKENIEKITATDIYKEILIKSKLYLKNNNFFVNKDYNTSFEIISLFLIIKITFNINNNINNYKKINEELIKIFISDLDESLREKGIGDMSIGKYVKSYVKKFYFRLSKFPKSLKMIDKNIVKNYFENFKFINIGDENKASEIYCTLFSDISTINK